MCLCGQARPAQTSHRSLKQESFVVVNEDSNCLIFINKAEKGVQEGCFTINGVYTLETGQDKLFLEQLQPLMAMVSLGYSASLLVYDTHHCGVQAQIQYLVQKVIEYVFQESSSPPNNSQFLKTISFVQIYSDGQAKDLLHPENPALQVMDLPPLGLVVKEATEIVVTDSQAATHFYHCGVSAYHSCLEQSFQKSHNTIILFTITIETKLAEGQELQRATVRIFEFLGGNEQSSTDPFFPFSWASSAVSLLPEAGFLSWILKQLLEDNTLTFLLLCLTLPDAPGKEILSAISLTEQVRTVTKRVAPTHWDPTQEAQKRREAIGELRAQLFLSDRTEQDSKIIQLEKVIKELQVLKSQNWEKKKKSANEIKEKDTSFIAKSWASEQDQGIKARFSLAKTKKQNLQKQHQILIQQELSSMEKELEGQEKIPPFQEGALLWQKEKPFLTLYMEALQKEQEEAEKDLEKLYQEYQHEAKAQKQHFLQVFRAYKSHVEDQMDALEKQYRKLLKESLQDAISLSVQNQQLRVQKQLDFTDTATQTDFQTLKNYPMT
ncbi:kinesin-like protein KIF17 isoform X2 [Anolis carolinensis]|uniref:kinesin-like protein KIF17 isoform X2 n=1 Tax=Anolis carolinensis TaxID=28377 RepID=UPI002F2B54A8